ncbi:ferredoxin--NADP reductase [Endozoicomonas sp. G2_2]|uniref:ferredoxin--NADP reductase n=1 Tax=Gammaproteobacteria TaxID=1236 RepID=UPI000C5BA77C|nr:MULTISPECIES: ferredoxin--NADP reductase [Gammaproteobacteria]MAS10671.1 ferredoxin--NADP(+) reductase [Salinisphaera sp.]MBO9470198.1 ferredoxin--NADP reductase [Endozoicomonas sp. G2_2]|tara:strand:- start:2541 stop:3317 length:777 start_codon:yes stop_codon:yes gene_type:complete
MAALNSERVLSVRHWNDSLFSFTTTRDRALRFENGQFVMIGLAQERKPLLRAYSIVSANYEEHLEFFSIKVPDGPLTSQLQHLEAGDEVLVSRKPTGTLLISDLHPGRNLYLLSTGTGLAPFLSIVRDPETYERFERVIVMHGVRYIDDLAYHELLSQTLPNDELLGEMISRQMHYYPVVSREPYENSGRVTTLLDEGRVTEDLGLEPLDPKHDRAMICGSPAMLEDSAALLDARGFEISPHIGAPGDYVIERAFVSK